MEEKKEFFQPKKPRLKGVKVIGKIEVNPVKKVKPEKSSTKYSGDEIELRAKIGYQFDKVWKEEYKTRTYMQEWAIKLLKLKIPVKDFSLNKLTVEQVQLLGLKLKFEFNIFE